jgi:predicted short-subunit dehydrogenase-like oxidoreductase (DUF2520 family)
VDSTTAAVASNRSSDILRFVARQLKPQSRTVTLIGAGNLAQAIGPALRSAGYRIEEVAARNNPESMRRARAFARKVDASVVGLEEIEPKSEIIWLCHTDDALAATAKLLAQKSGWRNKIVLHSSGALTSDVLARLKRAGAHTASLHPMMTFVPGTAPDMSAVPFAVEGDKEAVAAAKQIVARLGAEVFEIKKSAKVLYHALGSFSSPLIVATLVTAERVGQAAGLTMTQTRKIMAPILRQTLDNYLKGGPAAAFSGPIKRGDLETIRRHVRELKRVPFGQDVYRALVRSALRDLPGKNKKGLLALLTE